jgi:hypothetical protein
MANADRGRTREREASGLEFEIRDGAKKKQVLRFAQDDKEDLGGPM